MFTFLLKLNSKKPIKHNKDFCRLYLWFSAKDNEPLNDNDVFLILIEFEDGTKIPAKGKIINKIVYIKLFKYYN
ncbi:MAG: hypothetical protein ACP5SC_08325 [Desulfurella sp.]